MIRTALLAASLAVACAGSAFAQKAATEYYVVQDTSTMKCTIVDKKPESTTHVVVDNGVFKSRTEAETGMKSIKVCSSN